VLQKVLQSLSKNGEKWIVEQSLVNLGFSKLALREVAEAQVCFLMALRLASETNLIACILDSLAGIAWIYAGQGKEGVAMDLIIQVEKHPAVTQDTKARPEELRLVLETQLTPTQIEMAQARASEKTFEAVVEELLR